MLDLLIATLEMMGLTFVIGFFVAFIIKMIAVAADSFDFYSSHQKELLRRGACASCARRWSS